MSDPSLSTAETNSNATANPRRRMRFSLLSLMLFTGLVCLGVSHFQTSRTLHRTQQALRVANNELGYLTIDDPGQFAVIALPNFGPGPMQWRWRLYLPLGKRYQFRWAFDNVPEAAVPPAPRENHIELLDQFAKPAAKGEPMIVTLAVSKNIAGKWQISAGLPRRGIGIYLQDPPAWLEDESHPGWGSRIAGQNRTHTVPVDEPLVLLRYRKGKQVPPNGWTVETQPTDGLIVWIEEVPVK